MKKVIVYACVSIAVLLLCFGIVRQRKTIFDENRISSYVKSDSSNIPNKPVLKFADTKYDFGTFKAGEKLPINVINIDYEFQNVGNAPLVISKVDVSCGCLSVDFPQKPIMPKEKGVINVKVNTQGITGTVHKTLFVRSNATEDIILLRVVGQIK